MSIDSYKEELLNSPSKKSENVYQRVADAFEDDLLEFDDFPPKYFDFVLELLSDKDFYSKPGLWNFLLVIGTESHKLERSHYEKLSNTISESYGEYIDEDLCLAVCDFIARNYDYEEAKKLLLSLADKEKDMSESGFAFDGLRILELEKQRANQK